jgi:hypothetical protein
MGMDKFRIGVIAGGAFIAVLLLLAYLQSTAPGDYDGFATCLTEKGFIMAGTDWCTVCRQQKALFGNSFRLVNYKNCDTENVWCAENRVTGYPTWFDAEGNSYRGPQQLETLSALSGCSLQTDKATEAA